MLCLLHPTEVDTEVHRAVPCPRLHPREERPGFCLAPSQAGQRGGPPTFSPFEANFLLAFCNQSRWHLGA